MSEEEILALAIEQTPCATCGHTPRQHRWDILLGLQECKVCRESSKATGASFCTEYLVPQPKAVA